MFVFQFFVLIKGVVFEEKVDHRMNINNLNGDLLAYLFEFLPVKQIFINELVCKKWQRYVRKLLARKITTICFGTHQFPRNSVLIGI